MAPSFQQRAIKDGPLLGATLAFNMPFTAHLMGRVGFDWVLIDMEHSPLSASETTSIVHAVSVGSSGKCASMVRVPSSGVEWIKWALDSGAAGIIVPMVTSRSEVEAIVQRARYPPLGQRSFGPFNAPWADLDPESNVAKYFAETAQGVAVVPMIESVQGVKNAEDIMNTKGISGVFIGPVDLRLSMGLSGADGTEEQYVQALETILSIGKRLGLAIGIYSASADAVKKHVKMGFTFVLVSGDSTALVSGAHTAIEGSRAAIRELKL